MYTKLQPYRPHSKPQGRKHRPFTNTLVSVNGPEKNIRCSLPRYCSMFNHFQTMEAHLLALGDRGLGSQHTIHGHKVHRVIFLSGLQERVYSTSHSGSLMDRGILFKKQRSVCAVPPSLIPLRISDFCRGYTLLVSGTSPCPNPTIKSSKMNNR